MDNEYERYPVEYNDMTLTLPENAFAKEKEIYVSVVKGVLYLKTKRQYSRFMNGAKRMGQGKIVEFYHACCNNTYVIDYNECKLEVCPEIAEVLPEDEAIDIVLYNDNSGAVIAAKSFLDEKLN